MTPSFIITRLRRHSPLVTSCLLCALCASACSDEKKADANGIPESTSGGEDETNGLSKKMPAGAAPTPGKPKPGPQQAAAGTKDYRPKIPDAPPVQSEKEAPPPPSGPSPWGAPDAESGKPLPPRPKMNAAARKAFDQATAAARNGDLPAARAGYEQALAADSRAFAAAYNAGVIVDRQGQTNQALQFYARALKIQPDYEDAVEGMVRIDLRQGSAAQAVAHAQPVAQQWERNLALQAILAQALVEANRLDEAEQVARKALRRDERFVPAMVALASSSIRRGRLELADSILEQAIAIDPKYPELHFMQGQRHLQEGRLAQALASYRKAAQLRPSYSEARMALGIQYMAAGNYVDAQTEFEAVSKLVPTLVAVHLNLGDAYRANRRWQDAKRELDQALRMQDPLPEAHFNLGLLYMDAGAEFPNLTLLDSLQRAVLEFTAYRTQMGSRLAKDDTAAAYIADLQRQVDREKKRIEREAARKKTEAERAARNAAVQQEQKAQPATGKKP